MFPKTNFFQSNQYQQQGNIIVIVVFILLVLGVLGVAVVRVISHSSAGILTEVYGARAVQAAESGIEVFLTELFPLNPAQAVPVCTAYATNQNPNEVKTYSFQSEGLRHCTATIYCDQQELNPSINTDLHYRVISKGECRIAKQFFTRQIIVEAKSGAL